MPSRPVLLRRLIALAAWLVLFGIVFATLAPLDARPESGMPAGIERFGAFALMALLFALAYPRRIGLLILLMLGASVGLEVLQTIAVHRHARINDAEVKLAGALAGLAGGLVLLWLRPRIGRRAGSRAVSSEPSTTRGPAPPT
jgi:hypothetical protein